MRPIPKEGVQGVKLDKVIDAVATSLKVNGITNGNTSHPAVNGTNGVKTSWNSKTHLGDTSLPPAAIEVSPEISEHVFPSSCND